MTAAALVKPGFETWEEFIGFVTIEDEPDG
jgi:hypothetical protein